MDTSNKINLEFSCCQTRNDLKKSSTGYQCDLCPHQVIDFTAKSDLEIQKLTHQSRKVCGIFKRSQLNRRFLQHAALTLAITLPSMGCSDPLIEIMNTTPPKEQPVESEELEFLGVVVEVLPTPIGGYAKFYESLTKNIKISNLHYSGKFFVQWTINVDGTMSDPVIFKGISKALASEVLESLKEFQYPFEPSKQRGVDVKSRIIIPIRIHIR